MLSDGEQKGSAANTFPKIFLRYNATFPFFFFFGCQFGPTGNIKLTNVMSSQIKNAPNVASSWLSWISMLITWTEELSVGVRLSKAVKEQGNNMPIW
jgi:hypothetical protein